jgi:hypothetical protein
LPIGRFLKLKSLGGNRVILVVIPFKRTWPQVNHTVGEKRMTQSQVVDRCRKLGLQCDTIPTDSMSSALAALCCFPMYMVANVDAWTSDSQFRVPILDLPGSEHIREAFALGTQEQQFTIEKQHRRVLSTLVANAKPSDLVFYEYALETLRLVLDTLAPSLAEKVRAAVARTIVAVAKASGEGIGGGGQKISPHERDCIEFIDTTLSLSQSESAAAILAEGLS